MRSVAAMGLWCNRRPKWVIEFSCISMREGYHFPFQMKIWPTQASKQTPSTGRKRLSVHQISWKEYRVLVRWWTKAVLHFSNSGTRLVLILPQNRSWASNGEPCRRHGVSDHRERFSPMAWERPSRCNGPRYPPGGSSKSRRRPGTHS